jgi:hypothetical protein
MEYNQNDLFKKVMEIAQKYEGKSANELLKAIYEEAEKGKKNGTLTNEEIDALSLMLSPFLDQQKRKILEKIVTELKKI